jgi:hypothetical protein
MAAPISLRQDFDGPGLRALVLSEKAGTVTRRLLALVTIYDGGTRSDAARFGGVGLQTLKKIPRRPGEYRGDHRQVARVVVPERSPHRSKEQDHPTLGRTRHATFALKDQRTASACIFDAICAALGKAVGLVPAILQHCHFATLRSRSPCNPAPTPFCSWIKPDGASPPSCKRP